MAPAPTNSFVYGLFTAPFGTPNPDLTSGLWIVHHRVKTEMPPSGRDSSIARFFRDDLGRVNYRSAGAYGLTR